MAPGCWRRPRRRHSARRNGADIAEAHQGGRPPASSAVSATAMSRLATIAAAVGSAHQAFPYTCSVVFWQGWHMSADVIGRPAEVEAIERFLDALADGSAVLLLE